MKRKIACLCVIVLALIGAFLAGRYSSSWHLNNDMIDENEAQCIIVDGEKWYYFPEDGEQDVYNNIKRIKEIIKSEASNNEAESNLNSEKSAD